MSQIKTAVSIDENIFKQANRLAHQIHVSRSRLFEIALREWLTKQKKKQIVQSINHAVDQDSVATEDKIQTEFMKAQHKKNVQDKW